MQSSELYNKHYYQLHQAELREKARLRERRKRAEASRLKSTSPKSFSKGSRTVMLVELAILPLLLACVTYLLLNEMVSFYSIENGSTALSWIKAIAMESTVLVFSFLGSSEAFRGLLYKLIAVSACVFSTYAMCAQHYSSGATLTQEHRVTQEAIADMENAIRRKEIQSDEYRAKGWIGAVRRTEQSVDQLRDQLAKLRATLIELKPASATLSTTLAEIIFRILLMATSLLASDRLRHSLKCFETFKEEHGISRTSLKLSKPKIEISKRVNHSRPRGIGDWFGRLRLNLNRRVQTG